MAQPPKSPKLDWGIGHYERTAERLLPAARVLVDAAALRPGQRVLDLGCGTGNAALLAAAAGAVVTAVDPSPRLVEVTRGAAEREGRPVTCNVGEAADLPVADDSIDCLLSNFGVIFAPDPDAAVAEIARVLAADGRVLLTAWKPGGTLGALAQAAQELVRQALGAPPPPPGFPWHDEPAVRELFERHGMNAAVAGHHELAFIGPTPEAYLEAELASHPLAVTGFQILSERGQADHARHQLLRIAVEGNEDPPRFRSTSHYVVVAATIRDRRADA